LGKEKQDTDRCGSKDDGVTTQTFHAQGVCSGHSAIFDAAAGRQKTRAVLGTDVAEVDRLLALEKRSVEDRRGATEQRRLS
jgi:hypothetical protein